MAYLVTGGTGFIGSALVRRLIAAGREVTVLTREGSRLDRLAGCDGVRFCTYSARDYDHLGDAIGDAAEPLEGVFHLAVNMRYLGDRATSYLDNVVFTRRLLEWSATRKCRFFAYTSSIEAVGPSPADGRSLGEEASCRPVSVYGWSKLEAEKVVCRMGQELGVRTISFRFGNVYGPGSRFIVVDIARAIQQGSGHPLVRYYHQVCRTRLCPAYVDDVVEGICKAESSAYAGGDVFLLPGRQMCCVGDLFAEISRGLGQPFEPGRGSLLRSAAVKIRNLYFLHWKRRADSVTYFQLGNWCFESEKAGRVLGFRPQMALATGIAKTLQWGRESGFIR